MSARSREERSHLSQNRSNPIRINEAFVCHQCGFSVEPVASGTCRDHCPRCLWGQHVDRETPGDRLSACRGELEPVAVEYGSADRLVIHFRCIRCRVRRRNRAARDDDPDLLVELTGCPLPRSD
ncbi:MAG: RNHCP domain-containing protein [Planctomycetota bacterium]|nr:RNHCP domain-containing protein [Planctomycetota bacterium]